MSLHDTDKNSDKRQKPALNHSDQLLQRKATGTTSLNPVSNETVSSSAILMGAARLVARGNVTFTAPNGTPGVITQTTATVAHSLPFTPLVVAYMNNITGTGYGQPLPMWVSFGDNTGGVGGATEYLGVIRYMTYAVDGTNLYILTYSSGVALGSTYAISYYLYQQVAQ